MVKTTVIYATLSALIVLLQLFVQIAHQTIFYRMRSALVQPDNTTKAVFVPL